MSLESIRKKNGSIMDLKASIEDLNNIEYNLSSEEVEELRKESRFYELKEKGMKVLKENIKSEY